MTGRPLLSYYGDDFTGSTDVMEALSSNGVPTVLYTGIPDAARTARFADCRAVGIAGTSRSQTPEWMDTHLPAIFGWLEGLGADHCHYKVCSTFDSAPRHGSIGRAIEIGLAVFDQQMTALVVGAPQLRRYSFFGNLFVGYRDCVYRLDRHPVMRDHPATPMGEADLLRHLGQQTELPTALLGPQMDSTEHAVEALRRLRDGETRCVLLDVYDTPSQQRTGKLLYNEREHFGPFVVGSSGVEYALLHAWRKAGQTLPAQASPPLEKFDRIAVVSGSCSPTTARQIDAACANGFAGVPVDFRALATGQGADAALAEARDQACAALECGRSPLLYTARGPDSVARSIASSHDRVGRALGRLLQTLTDRYGLPRVVIAGGDTSSHALAELDVFALTLRHPIPDSPGSPLCTAHRNDGSTLELALKGGQIGGDDYFVGLRDGTLG
ncbi:four-carbon acid sugar kinase family protein [Chelativorans sp. M5D2P16]|uniref:four-carbon acid sugar kinase family protein n=1 Tax=Chelativorans sp. M5D2P16 TaxID=3095678 RepID=UPI002ACA1418|nr:four-carbon acid sugar kinase family protein [Chelativorans sp. M5D2P16]MDZ5696511.1 four-carbon acid sugar kinase family protein [Chelativorans sp. M5D2P16]